MDGKCQKGEFGKTAREQSTPEESVKDPTETPPEEMGSKGPPQTNVRDELGGFCVTITKDKGSDPSGTPGPGSVLQ